MATQAIDLSSGLVPKSQSSIDLSSGLVPKSSTTQGVPESHWLAATGDTLKELAKGVGEGAMQTVNSVSRVINKIPGVGETLAPSSGIAAARNIATPANKTQRIGAGIEQAAEFMTPMGEMGLPAKIGLNALKGTNQDISGKDVALGAAIGGGAEALGAGAKALLTSKAARGAVNESVMATARDVTYGNPAKALLDEGIKTPFTGDLEKFKDAIRGGSTLQGASEAAGGRIAAISDKINQIAPQLKQTLAASTVKIPASTVTDVIDNGIAAIKANRGVTAAEVQSAEAELQAIKDAALKVPMAPGIAAKSWAPLEANTVKQEIGQSVNWEGRERIGQLVDPIKKQIYGALKDAVNKAAPGSAPLNERLTNLLAAQTDVNKLAGFEEVGRGRSMGGVIGPSWMGRAEALAGRFIPGASWLTSKTPIAKGVQGVGIPAATNSGTPNQ